MNPTAEDTDLASGGWMQRSFPQLPPGVGSRSELPVPAQRFGAAVSGSEVVHGAAGEGHRDYLSFSGGLHGLHAHFKLRADSAVPVDGADLLKFHFKLSGNNTVRFGAKDDGVSLRSGCMVVAIHPRGVTKLDCHLHDALEHSLTFACRPALLTQTLRLDPESLPQPLRAFAQGADPAQYLRVLPLTARVTKTIEEMLSSPYSGRFSHVHAEARALDLICMVLDVLVNEEEAAAPRLNPRDVQALEAVREYLASHFMNPPTISELAREAAMNRTKLTQGFRALFNETILDYCQRLRMQQAREMLLAGAPVGNVAAAVGYEHHSSFAHAFRAYFGFSPVEIRRPRRP